MQNPISLDKNNRVKYIEGFNSIKLNGPQVNRNGWKREGQEFARTILLFWQISEVEQAHEKLPEITLDNFEQVISDMMPVYQKAAVEFEYPVELMF